MSRIGIETDPRDGGEGACGWRGWRLCLLALANLLVLVPMGILTAIATQWHAHPGMALYDTMHVWLAVDVVLAMADVLVVAGDLVAPDKGGRKGPWHALAAVQAVCCVVSLATVPVVLEQRMGEDIKASYDVSGVESVAVDHGRPTAALVRFRTGDGTEFEMPAFELGYTDVVSDDGIEAPEDRLEPEGATLAVPHSCLVFDRDE